jgi:hypothetical protein
MMGHTAIIKLAIDLLHFPSQARSMRSAPLPDDVLILLCILAGDEGAIGGAAALTGRSPDTVREAAAFFIEQILLFPGADSYRVLGVRPDATYGELRRNMALLLRRLHPDRNCQAEQAVFAARVTRAWSDLKTPERRAAYDRQFTATAQKAPFRENRGTGHRSNKQRANPRRVAKSTRPVFYRRSGPIYASENSRFMRRIWSLFFGKAVL